MDFTPNVLLSLLQPLLSVASNEWSKKAEFATLRHLAYERLSRELYWNAECLWKSSDDPSAGYLEILRTDAFDLLVTTNVPLDILLREPVRSDWLEAEPYSQLQFKQRIDGCIRISDLVDKVYNRIWMLKHMKLVEFSNGDIEHLLDVLLFTLAHINLERRDIRASRLSLRNQLAQIMPWN